MLELLRKTATVGPLFRICIRLQPLVQLVKNHLPRAAKVINRCPPGSTGYVPFEPSTVYFTQRKGTVPFLAGLKPGVSWHAGL